MNRGVFRGGKGARAPPRIFGANAPPTILEANAPHIFGSEALHYTAPLSWGRFRFRSNNYIFLGKIEPISFELKMIGLMMIIINL